MTALKNTLPLIIFLLSLPSHAIEKKLSGTLMGCVAVDYTTSKPSTTVNTWKNAFDGDFSTFFASYDRSNTWVGIDLKTKHVISKVAFAPRANWSSRTILGVFEGANKPDFSDALPLTIIKEEPFEDEMTELTVNCSRGFRYVRYVGPNDSRCNIAELAFYGEPGEGDDHQLYQLTNLPVVVMHTFDNVPIETKTTRIPGICSVISRNGTEIKTDSMRTRGRGNGSWTFTKKSYSIKLANKARLCGMPAKDKRWNLISNEGDKTLIRNLLAFECSRQLGMTYTPAGTLVDVMLNGEYMGTYQLTDQVEVGKNRIEITTMDSTCLVSPEVTGGYLIEINGESTFTSNKGNPVRIRYPDDEDIKPQQTLYMKNFFNRMESRVYSAYYTDPLNGYAPLLDAETYITGFLLGEITANTDTYYSVYMSKDRGTNEKLKYAAGWDFDLAFENDRRTYPVNTRTGSTYLALGSTSSAVGKMKDFTSRIVNSQTATIKRQWSEARIKGLGPKHLLEYTDSLVEAINESQQLNFTRWPILNTLKHQNFQALGSYAAEVEFMKKFITNRFSWMDRKIGFDATAIQSATNELAGIVQAASQSILLRGFEDGGQYDVYSLDGSWIKTGDIVGNETKISVPSGFYIVRITTNNGQKAQQKVLVR